MAEARLETRDGTFEVVGEMTFASVGRLLSAGEALFDGGSGGVSVSLAGVSRADSAGVALLIEWLRRGRAAGREVRYTDPPEQLLAIVRLSDLEAILPLA